jgi:hypothetical protein
VETRAPTAGRPSITEQARRAALWTVAALAVALTVGSSAQILLVVFAPEQVGQAPACRQGVRDLLTSLDRARSQAASRLDGEQASLDAFRRALAPEWALAPAILADCGRQRDGEALVAFRQLELLRYAEERAVRYEALDLSRLRKRAPALVGSLLPHQP